MSSSQSESERATRRRSTTGTGVDPSATPLFIDTGAFFAYYNDHDEQHTRARAVFREIQAGNLAYEPLYTTRFVLSELATLLLFKVNHATASRALEDIHTAASFNVLQADAAAFTDARAEFDRYDDQTITLVDQLTGVLADERDVDRVFTFDTDFRTLGFTVVPDDTGEA